MRAVAASRGRSVVVVNATEGEPASHKDHVLACAAPHLILDGAVLTAQAVGADIVLVGACEPDGDSVYSLARAIAERASRTGGGPSMELVATPAGYVRGEESALIDYLDGGAGLPRFSPQPPFERGVGGRPTLSSNAETFAHIALICRHGADWFRQLGSRSEPGSALVTLTGPVAEAGVFEIELGTPLGSLIAAAGGLTAPAHAALIGGYGGTWVRSQRVSELPLSDEGLEPHGASLGAGVVALLDDDACPVAETARLLRWLANESAGQCGPCIHGLDAIAAEFAKITSGATAAEQTQRLQHLTAIVHGRGACGHPDGAVRLAQSALAVFASDIADHAAHGACDGCLAAPHLRLPLR
jgi:NADH:ubiquinone oxidoreductase subunit F (NADH-binding)